MGDSWRKGDVSYFNITRQNESEDVNHVSLKEEHQAWKSMLLLVIENREVFEKKSLLLLVGLVPKVVQENPLSVYSSLN